MKVSLVDYTGAETSDPADYAASLLIFTKSTRLKMEAGLFNEIRYGMSKEKKLEELEYMANTIPSSWEVCHYTFMIEGVTRAFTHQLVRTRTASFAQQTMRVLDVGGWRYATGPSIKDDPGLTNAYDNEMGGIADTYDNLIENGAAIEDARGILPTNILTNIVMGANLRTMVEMIRKRSSPRTQGEYREVLDGLKAEMVRVHPWVELFINRTQDQAAQDLDAEIMSMSKSTTEENEKRVRMLKFVDQLRSS